MPGMLGAWGGQEHQDHVHTGSMRILGTWGPQEHEEHGDVGSMRNTWTLGAWECWEYKVHEPTGCTKLRTSSFALLPHLPTLLSPHSRAVEEPRSSIHPCCHSLTTPIPEPPGLRRAGRMAGTPLCHVLHWYRDIVGPNDLSWVTKSHYTPETVPAASSALQQQGKGPFIHPPGKLRH